MAMAGDLQRLARAVLARTQSESRDTTRDTRGTPAKISSEVDNGPGTAKSIEKQSDTATVPVSHALGDGTLGQPEKSGTAPGTVVGQQFLRAGCPDHVPADRWQQAIADAEAFAAEWGEQAHALGWTDADLFALHTPPAKPASSYRRLSRYDCTGLIWLLQGRPVIELTETAATIRAASGATLTFRRTRGAHAAADECAREARGRPENWGN
jgi:hypothetical protein